MQLSQTWIVRFSTIKHLWEKKERKAKIVRVVQATILLGTKIKRMNIMDTTRD